MNLTALENKMYCDNFLCNLPPDPLAMAAVIAVIFILTFLVLWAIFFPTPEEETDP